MAALAIASCSSNGDSASTKADSYEVMNKAITQAGQEAASKAMETARANDMARTQSTATTVTDPWIVSQKAEFRSADQNGSREDYLYTVIVKKDKLSLFVDLVDESTDMDGDWDHSSSAGFPMELIQDNPDGTTTYQATWHVYIGFDSLHKPYQNQKFHYRFKLMNKQGQSILESSWFCYSELPC